MARGEKPLPGPTRRTLPFETNTGELGYDPVIAVSSSCYDTAPLAKSGRLAGPLAVLNSIAEFRRSIENLICEMDKMLCRHRKASVVSVCGQIDQPFGQGKWANQRTHQSVYMAHMHDADLRVVTPSGFPRDRRPCSFSGSRQLQTCRAFSKHPPERRVAVGRPCQTSASLYDWRRSFVRRWVFPSPPRVSSLREADISLNQRWPCLSLLPINVSYADCTVVSREFIAILTEAFWHRFR